MQTHTCPCGIGPGVPRQGFLPFQTQAKQQELLLLSGVGGINTAKPPWRNQSLCPSRHLVLTTWVNPCPSAEPQGGLPRLLECRMAVVGRHPRSYSPTVGRAPHSPLPPLHTEPCLPLAKQTIRVHDGHVLLHA